MEIWKARKKSSKEREETAKLILFGAVKKWRNKYLVM